MKKIGVLLLTLLSILVLSLGTNEEVYAETAVDVDAIVDDANDEIYALIDDAILEADLVIAERDSEIAEIEAELAILTDLETELLSVLDSEDVGFLEYIAASCNLVAVYVMISYYEYEIDNINEIADQEIAEIIDELLVETNAVSENTISLLSSYGVEVVCDDVLVVIGGVEVYVDPLRVVEF